ncbi:MAG: hypothetical protein F6K65_03345 [Moorea sp. SIO3C2]|nr:hypothetical protein [Moorena sp. SIO3C2]
MDIKDINFNDVKIDLTKNITSTTNAIEGVKKDQIPFVFTGCKGLMLDDFDSLPIITTVEPTSIAASTGL